MFSDSGSSRRLSVTMPCSDKRAERLVGRVAVRMPFDGLAGGANDAFETVTHVCW